MGTVSQIKLATKQLRPKERIALFRWLSTQDDILAPQKKDLLTDLDQGIAQANRGELISGRKLIDRLRSRAQQPA